MINTVNINYTFYIIVELLTKDNKQTRKQSDAMNQVYIIKIKYDR